MKKLGLIAALLVLGGMLSIPARADTSAGATIFNQATLTFNGGTEVASVKVGVALKPVAPQITAPSNPGTPTTSGGEETLIYTIVAKANGRDTYDLSNPNSVTNCTQNCGALSSHGITFLDGTTGNTAITDITLEAVITSQPSEAGKIVIPAGAEANLTAGTIVDIGGFTYVVGTIEPGTVAAVNTPETPTKVPLTPGGTNPGAAIGAGDVLAGVVVGEVKQFRAVIATGILSGGATEGEHDIVVRATSQTDNTELTDASTVTITVSPVQVTITKQVANVTDASLGPACGSPPCFGSSNSVSARTGHVLRYRITMSVPDDGDADPNEHLTGAVLTDVVPDYTSYVTDTLVHNSDNVAAVNGTDGGTLPLIGGFTVNSPGGGDGSGFNGDGTAGTIVEGGTATVTFDVTVD